MKHVKMPNISLEDNIKKVEEFRKLEKDWNMYDADPLPLKVIDNAIEILKHLDIQPKVFPTAADSIQFEYEEEIRTDEDEPISTAYIEFEVKEDKIDMMRLIAPSCDYYKEREIALDDYKALNKELETFGFTEE